MHHIENTTGLAFAEQAVDVTVTVHMQYYAQQPQQP